MKTKRKIIHPSAWFFKAIYNDEPFLVVSINFISIEKAEDQINVWMHCKRKEEFSTTMAFSWLFEDLCAIMTLLTRTMQNVISFVFPGGDFKDFTKSSGPADNVKCQRKKEENTK